MDLILVKYFLKVIVCNVDFFYNIGESNKYKFILMKQLGCFDKVDYILE